MNRHWIMLWQILALVAFLGACDTVAEIANGTYGQGGASGAGGKGTGSGGKGAGGSGAGGSSASAGSGAGGTTSTGGVAATGGNGATGGSSGGAGSGGASGSGGANSAGGSAGTSSGGGNSATGGAKASGGASAAGGSTGAGGTSPAGGSTGTGGTSAAGGSSGADCTMCHGDRATNNPAPPRDTAGNTDTASAGVGAHGKHLTTSTWHRQGKCTDCHVVPTSIPHANGIVDFNWTAPANASNAKPSFDTTTYTCTGAYCHGTTLAGASAVKTSPVWNQVNETWNACGAACHMTPPPASTGHTTSTACETCHSKVIASFKAGTTPTVVWKDPSLHVNGTVEVDALTCTSCHGSGTDPTPPKDTQGNTATTAAGVGAHAQHLASSTWHRQGQCADCHTTPTSTGHSNGKVDFTWGAPSNASGASPSFSTNNLTCSGVYCHGTEMADQSTNVIHSPVWNKVDGTQDACGKSCHATPPSSSPHTSSTTACQSCHGAVIATFNGASSTWKDATKHINGTVEATMNCSSCHGSNGVPTLPPSDGCHRMVNNGSDRCAACHGSGTSKTVAPTSGHNDGKATYSSGSSGGLTFSASNMTCTSSCHGTQTWNGSCSGD